MLVVWEGLLNTLRKNLPKLPTNKWMRSGSSHKPRPLLDVYYRAWKVVSSPNASASRESAASGGCIAWWTCLFLLLPVWCRSGTCPQSQFYCKPSKSFTCEHLEYHVSFKDHWLPHLLCELRRLRGLDHQVDTVDLYETKRPVCGEVSSGENTQ